MIYPIGKQFTWSIDTDEGLLVIEDHLHIIEIPVSKIIEILPVTWNKAAGETFDGVSKKATGRKQIYPPPA